MLRKLNRIEESFTLSNEAHPLCVCIVLRMRGVPPMPEIRRALDRLQHRHLLLQSRIEQRGRRLVFERLPEDTKISLVTVPRTDPSRWETVVEKELNTRFDRSGPLVRLLHVSGDSEESELILVLHHAIMDGISARLLLHELLFLLSGERLPEPLAETRQIAHYALPPAYRGLRVAPRLATFALAQMWDEATYARKGINAPVARSPHNRIIHFSLPADVSRRIGYRVGREGLSLNSAVGAAILLAVRRRLHRDEPRSKMRAIAFADLRPALEPVPSEAVLGSMISMMRFTLPVTADASLLEVAHELRQVMYRGGKAGAPFLFYQMSKFVTQRTLRNPRARMASSALSFHGKLDLRSRYGDMELSDVHAFITNNPLGPELSGFGKILFGRLELDLTFLTSEIPDALARELVDDIEVSLTSLSH